MTLCCFRINAISFLNYLSSSLPFLLPPFSIILPLSFLPLLSFPSSSLLSSLPSYLPLSLPLSCFLPSSFPYILCQMENYNFPVAQPILEIKFSKKQYLHSIFMIIKQAFASIHKFWTEKCATPVLSMNRK